MSMIPKTSGELEALKKIYSLDSIERKINVSKSFFERFCKNETNFIIAIVRNQKNQVLLVQNPVRLFQWELPGGRIHPEETFLAAVTRVVEGNYGIKITQLRPVKSIVQVFCYRKERVKHEGLVYSACCYGCTTLNDNGRNQAFFDEEPSNLSFMDKRLIQETFNVRRHSLVLNEVESINGRLVAYTLTKIVNKIAYALLGNPVERFVTETLAPCSSVIDIAAGDSNIISRLSKSKLRIVNDVSKDILFSSKSQGVVMLNEEVLTNRIKTRFDAVLCKNLLHHMHDQKNQLELLKTLKRLAKKTVLVVEIEDPNKFTLAKAWNYYYRTMLADQGEKFLDRENFSKLIKRMFPNALIQTISTFKGNYMIANINIENG